MSLSALIPLLAVNFEVNSEHEPSISFQFGVTDLKIGEAGTVEFITPVEVVVNATLSYYGGTAVGKHESKKLDNGTFGNTVYSPGPDGKPLPLFGLSNVLGYAE